MSATPHMPRHVGNPADFLRSINVLFDIGFPERIAHYWPTSKTIPLIRQIVLEARPDNHLIVAPYGSGKSLLATYCAEVVENRPGTSIHLRTVTERIKELDDVICSTILDRIDEGQLVRPSGLAIVMHGHQKDIAMAFVDAVRNGVSRLGLDPSTFSKPTGTEFADALRWFADRLPAIRASAGRINVDLQRVVLLWDEFGRHLEELISNGRSADLNDVQTLAEFASRQRVTPFSTNLFLHQGLANYAAGLPQAARKEWKKVEGRFSTVQFVDDSAEMVSLIADIVHSIPEKAIVPTDRRVMAAIRSALDVGLLRDLPEEKLPELIRKAYPLEPATMYLLPRVAARVAQNERTLFTFLFAADLSQPVGPHHVFEYFSDSMRADTGLGGAYHQWLETQNALEKAPDDVSATVVRSAGLLGLGISGQRSRVGKELLEVATAGYRMPLRVARNAIDRLIRERLLLFRKNTNQVAIWHGVDIDLRGRLEEEKARIGLGFDVVAFIERELPPRAWLPLEYNVEFAITRYFAARYIRSSEIEAVLRNAEELIENADGLILHLVPDDQDDLDSLRARVAATRIPDRIVVSAPRRGPALTEAAIEVFTLRTMQEDDALTGEDPLVLPELRQMTDDALEHLRRCMLRVADPSGDGPIWFIHEGMKNISSSASFRGQLSEIARKVFPRTPRINNELIVRNRPRQVIVNARKKLIAAIMERTGSQDLGLDGYHPDRSMLNTVLLHTGLYRHSVGIWRFALPEELEDPKLAAVWSRFRDLLSAPSDEPKDLSSFFSNLAAPPIGLRRGLFPILFASALRAFPTAVSVTHGGVYVEDILPSTVESLCARPSDFEFRVLGLTNSAQQYLGKLQGVFRRSTNRTTENDLIRATYDAIQYWRFALPPAAMSTRRVSPGAASVRAMLSNIEDPVDVFFRRLPRVFGAVTVDDDGWLSRLDDAVRELDSVLDVYYSFATNALRQALQMRGKQAVLDEVGQWVSLIPHAAVENSSNSLAKALFYRLAMVYDKPERLIDSVASLLVDKTVNRWDDSTMPEFDIALRSSIAQIEEAALRYAAERENGTTEIARLAETRIENLVRYLEDMVGRDEARRRVMELMEKERILV